MQLICRFHENILKSAHVIYPVYTKFKLTVDMTDKRRIIFSIFISILVFFKNGDGVGGSSDQITGSRQSTNFDSNYYREI